VVQVEELTLTRISLPRGPVSRVREILEAKELAVMMKTTPEAVEVVRDQRALMDLGIKEEKAVTGEPLL
jgi:hypothetical protein